MNARTYMAQLLDNQRDNLNIPEVAADAALTSILNTIYSVAGIVAVIIIILAGYTYVISAGDAAGVKKAKNAILFSVVGLIVIMFAFIITNFVIGRF